GELYWPTAAFAAYNARLEAAEGRTLINPRNGCAGLVKRKDPPGPQDPGPRGGWGEAPRLAVRRTRVPRVGGRRGLPPRGPAHRLRARSVRALRGVHRPARAAAVRHRRDG